MKRPAEVAALAVGTLARGTVDTIGQHVRGERMPAGLFGERHSKRTVARRRGEDVPAGAFHDRILKWCVALEGVTNQGAAIYNADGVEFAAALIGALHARKKVYLPGDIRAPTCRTLHALDVVFVGSFSDAWHPISEPGSEVAQRELRELDATAAEVVIFTSGTTGTPQALPKRMSQLVREVRTLEKMFGAQLGVCDMLATVSHQHIYGLLFKILWPLVAQRTFVSESVESPEELLMHLERHRSAVISGPAQLKRLPVNLNWEAARNHVSAVFSSGGSLPLGVSASVGAALACTPTEIYGSSETGGIASRQRLGGVEQPWTPLAGVEVRDAAGQLSVRSPHLPDNEWHVVQDAVTMADNNQFVLHGRTDRIAKIEGKRVPLTGIETALSESALVAETRVVVLTPGNASARDELGAIVVPSEAGWALLRGSDTREFRRVLEELLRESTDRIAIPRRWRWLDALPVNASGKTTNEALTDLFARMSVTTPAIHFIELAPDHALLEIYASPHLDCLDGHFAAVAVLPGVAQLDWAIMAARKCFRMDEPFTHMEAIKFHRVYKPGPLLSLELNWASSRNVLSFRFSSSEGLHSSGRMHFGH